MSELIRQHPDMPQLYFLNGLAHLNNNETNAAKIEFGKIPAESPEFIKSRLLMADLFFKEQNIAQAKETLESIISISPDNLDAIKMMGSIYLFENKIEEAKSQFSKLIAIAPQNPEGYFRLGMIDKMKKDYGHAVTRFEQALSKDNENIDIFVFLVSTMLENNQLDQAIARCDEKLETLENKTARGIVYNLKGKIYLASNHVQDAENAFKSAIKAFPNFLPPYYSLAKVYLNNDRAEDAIAQYQKAIETEANQDIPHMILGVIFSMKKQYDLAEIHYRQALKANPDFVPAANNLAYLMAEKDTGLSEALRLAQQANDKMPDDPRILDTLGWVYVKLGLYDQAIQEFSGSMRQLADNPTIYFHLGLAYLKKGDSGKARSAFEKALEMDENFAEADQTREILSGM